MQTDDERKAKDREYSRRYRELHKEEIRAKRLANPEIFRARSKRSKEKHIGRVRAYSFKHREKIRLRNARWREDNPERKKAYGKWYREEHPDRVRESRNKFHAAHPEAMAEYLRRYNESPKGQANKANRAVRNRAAEATAHPLTWEQWQEIIKRNKSRCFYCKKRFPKDKLTIDHVIPISPRKDSGRKPGKHVKENIVPACRSCNSSKGNRLWLLI